MTRPSRRRQELLAIAADLFAARGFHAVTVDDIGAAAGVSGPALYHHFTGKEALLGEMLVSISEHLLDGATELAAGRPPDLLGQLVRFHCEFAVTRRSLITVHFRDLINAAPADRSRVRRLQSRYVGIWVDALVAEHPGLDQREAQAAVRAVFGLINSTPYSTTLPGSRMSELLEALALGTLAAVGSQRERGSREPSRT